MNRALVKDDIWQIRARVSHWIADADVQVILLTGGTGFTERDNTPQAVSPLLDKTVEGFGELFRQVSFDEIGTSTLQSRALAGFSNGTLICCLPGRPMPAVPDGRSCSGLSWTAVPSPATSFLTLKTGQVMHTRCVKVGRCKRRIVSIKPAAL